MSSLSLTASGRPVLEAGEVERCLLDKVHAAWYMRVACIGACQLNARAVCNAAVSQLAVHAW